MRQYFVHNKKKANSGFQNRLVITLFLVSTGVVFTLCLFTGTELHNLSSYMYRETEERMLSIGQYAATLVTAEELDELRTPSDMEKPLFGELHQRLIEFGEANNILYVYYYRLADGGMLQPIIDNDTTEDAYNLYSELIEMEEKPLLAFGGTPSATELQEYSAGYDNLISAFAPVYDSNGNIVAVAGVDISDDLILAIRTTMNALVPLLSAGVLLAAMCGLAMVLMHRRSDKNRQKALEEALLANQAKSDFLAGISHEMRTPLNAILGLSDLVLTADSYGKEERANVEKVYSAGATLLSTVNDILDISKIAAGKLELVPVEYDVPSLLNDTITQSIMFIGDKPIQFTLDIDENLPTRLYGDELRIKQIFNNLLSNAFKYTREGTVRLGVSSITEGETVLMTAYVRDTGIGIKPESMDKVFEDYGQVDSKANRKIMGTGLGMPLTKKLVDLMSGIISVESEYGKGSVFTVRFPQEFVTDVVIGKEIVENLRSFHYSDNKRQKNSTLERIKLPYAHVLVVDDVMTNLDVAKGLMKPYGMKIDCMTSGQEAINAVSTGLIKYNAIFMDHMMPGMDGIEATQTIRAIGSDYAKTVPIIALTANAIVGNEEMFLSKGFQSFLSKPIDIEKLDMVIRQWVRDKEQEKLFPNNQPNREEPVPDNPENGAADKHEIILLGKGIPGFDIEKGLQHFGGDLDSYLKVLRSYAVNTPLLLESCKNVSKDKLANYGITVHGVKGSSRSIGANSLGDMAEALEKTAKNGDYDFVAGHNEVFLDAAWKFLSGVNEMLSQINAKEQQPSKDKPDDAVLSRLLTACKNYDMDGVDAAMTELLRYQYETGAELVDWLHSNAQLMNFDQIIEKLEKKE